MMRIQMAKVNSQKAFIANKHKVEQRLLMMANDLTRTGNDVMMANDDVTNRFNNDDIFQLQHHHLLNCLEKTTVGFYSNTATSVAVMCVTSD